MTEQIKYNIGNGHEISVEYDEYNQAKITRECFEMLIGKQIPKEPIHNHHCPVCDRALPIKRITDEYCHCCFEWKYCPDCGQKLDWGNENDRED